MNISNRINNSRNNVVVNILQLFTTTVLSFVTRSIFINILGEEFLGLNGFFINILSMLSLTELGISTAINFSLFEPIAKNDKKKINILLSLFKKIYYIIGTVIFCLGLLIMPFLKYLINGADFSSLYLYFFIFVLDTTLSYFFTYKETLIIAKQKEYCLFPFKFVSTVLLYSAQIILLILTKNFICYLLVMLIVNFFRNLIINIYISKICSDVDFNCKDKVDSKTKKNIIKNVKFLFISKVGDYLLNGTDNILLSMINISLTGIYSNYLSVVSIMMTLINSIYNGVIASFGNLVVLEKKEVQENVFNISNFVGFLVSGLITIELIFLLNDFITVWLGSKYTVEFWIVIVISLNFYFYSQMVALNVIKKASGMYNIDAYISIIQAVINLIVSIILGNIIGLGGVVLGTLISYLLVACVFRPYLIYRKVFNKKSVNYFISQFKNLLTLVLIFAICLIIFKFINITNLFILILIKGVIILFVFIIIVMLFYSKNKNFQYLYDNFIVKFLKFRKIG